MSFACVPSPKPANTEKLLMIQLDMPTRMEKEKKYISAEDWQGIKTIDQDANNA